MFLISNTAKSHDLQKSAEPPRIFNILLNSLGKPGHSLHKGEKFKILLSFELCTLLFSLRCFACLFHETMTAAEKAGGVELSLFTKPVGLWHGADWDYVFFLIPSSPCRKLQCALAECWRRVGTGACHNVVMALSRSEDVKTRDARTCSRHLTPWGAPSCLHRTLLRSRLFIPHLPDS